MALPLEISALEDVDESLREHYEEAGDGFRLSGIPDTSTLEGTLKKERDARKDLEKSLKQFDGVDLEDYQKLSAEAKARENKKLLDAGKVDELLEQQKTQLTSTWDKERDTLTVERDTLSVQVKDLLVNDKLKATALGMSAHESALDDIIKRADGWTIQEGQPVLLDQENAPVLKNGVRITMDQWVEDLQVVAPHLFKQSNGGGAQPGSGNGQGGGTGRKRSDMSIAQKTVYIEEHGQEAYGKLPQ